MSKNFSWIKKVYAEVHWFFSPRRVYATWTDITRKKRTESERNESRMRWRKKKRKKIAIALKKRIVWEESGRRGQCWNIKVICRGIFKDFFAWIWMGRFKVTCGLMWMLFLVENLLLRLLKGFFMVFVF